MKTNLLTPALAWVFAAAAIAAPVTETTAIHTKPDATAPTVGYLKAGTEPTLSSVAAPAGWTAVELTGPFEAYVNQNDLTKGLDVKPGTSIRQAPKADGAVLAVSERGDKATITGFRGRWAQVSLQKNIVGYIKAPALSPAPAAFASSGPVSLPSSAPVATPVSIATTTAGQPAVASNPSDSASLPRQLTGRFVSTKSALHPRRPYEWGLEDNSGKRFAYVDTSKLLLTEQIDKYVGHFVVVFGAAKPTPDGKDFVIQVESLQLLLR